MTEEYLTDIALEVEMGHSYAPLVIGWGPPYGPGTEMDRYIAYAILALWVASGVGAGTCFLLLVAG